jgi:Zn-dependent peptidase ImmA (M78 family)
MGMSTGNQKITISASVLKWARKTLYGGNIDEAAIKIGITTIELSGWETNDPTITVSQLKKISKAYKRHISVLLLKTPPISQQPPSFRKLPDFDRATFERVTFLAIRQAQEIQNNAIYLLENKQNIFLEELRKSSNNVQTLIQKTIELLNMDEETRLKAKTSREQLIVWKRLLEARGIIVLELSFPTKDARAFVLFDKTAPIIVLNSKDTDNGQIFSLFHELGHLALGQTDIDKEFNLGITQQNDEFFCNSFSALFLVPDNLLKQQIVGATRFDDDYVKELAHHYKVSISVIWRKLRDNNLIDKTTFNRVKHRLSRFEAFSQPNQKRIFKANKNTHLYIKIKRKSEFFINEVFGAFNQNRITYYDVLNYIDINSKALPQLQRLMFT